MTQEEQVNLVADELGLDVKTLAARIQATQASLLTKADVVGGLIPAGQLPSYVDDIVEYATLGEFPAVGEKGKIYWVIGDTNNPATWQQYRWSGSAYRPLTASPGSTDAVVEGNLNLYHTAARAAQAAPVKSVAGRAGAVVLAKADVGLSLADNTADAAKPVSSAQQTALDGKVDKAAIGNPNADYLARYRAARGTI